jgi:hypothetical protein
MEQAAFVKLSEKRGATWGDIFIAFNRINAIVPHENGGSKIYMAEDVFHVRENPEEALRIMQGYTFVNTEEK